MKVKLRRYTLPPLYPPSYPPPQESEIRALHPPTLISALLPPPPKKSVCSCLVCLFLKMKVKLRRYTLPPLYPPSYPPPQEKCLFLSGLSVLENESEIKVLHPPTLTSTLLPPPPPKKSVCSCLVCLFLKMKVKLRRYTLPPLYPPSYPPQSPPPMKVSVLVWFVCS